MKVLRCSIVAPSFVGQFGKGVGRLHEGIQGDGLCRVEEVATGTASVPLKLRSFVKEVPEKLPFMGAASVLLGLQWQKRASEHADAISIALAAGFDYSSRESKTQSQKIVFIGPCTAKLEALRRSVSQRLTLF